MIREQKVERWAERELYRHIDNIIVNDNSNGFIAFGRYHLRPSTNGCWIDLETATVGHFSSKKTAISWCVADRYHQYKLANQIQTLDQKKQLLAADVDCRRRQIAHSKNAEFTETVTAKILPKISQLTSINAELDKCLKTAKYFQIRGFSNETARTRVS
jgi:phosphoglycerate-specific signal transduction histidine kinase